MAGKKRRATKGQQDEPTTADVVASEASEPLELVPERVEVPRPLGSGEEQMLPSPSRTQDLTPDTCATGSRETGARPKRHSKATAGASASEPVQPPLKNPEPQALPSHQLLPRRPGFGEEGRRIALVANYFQLNIPERSIHHYDVTITTGGHQEKTDKLFPGKARFRVINSQQQRNVVRTMAASNPEDFADRCPVYDGKKNLYTCQLLTIPEEGKDFMVLETDENGRPTDYTVQVKAAGVIGLDLLRQFVNDNHGDMADVQSGIMALDTVIRDTPSVRMVPVGRSFFTPPTDPEQATMSGGYQLWLGHFQSVRPTQRGVLLNIDKTGTAFYPEGPVMDFICTLFSKSHPGEFRILSDAQIRVLKEELFHVKFSVTYQGQGHRRVYEALGVTCKPARDVTFELEDKGSYRTVTVPEYLNERYEVTLQFPNLPCFEVKGKGDQPSYIPIELGRIEPRQPCRGKPTDDQMAEMTRAMGFPRQPCRGKPTDDQMAEMTRAMATPPINRFNDIREKARELNKMNRENSTGYCLTMPSLEPIQLNGRVLPPPNIIFARGKTSSPRDGSWDIRPHQILNSVSVSSWALISFSEPNCDQQCLQHFTNYFIQTARKKGLTFERPVLSMVEIHTCDLEALFRGLKERHPKLQLVMCILPTEKKGKGRVGNVDQNLRQKLKYVAETRVGLMTQCIRDILAQECKEQNVVNVCLKINEKMGGVNSKPGNKPDILKEPVMVIGVDAAHYGKMPEEQRMYAAAAGSVDRDCTQYEAVAIRCQVGREEVLQDLKGMIKELLQYFHKKWNRYPLRIILYRDGVSEGQFSKIFLTELPQIDEACEELGPRCRPRITFLVVQKRHHTQFMPRDKRDGVGKCKNIPPGTTVDTDVCHPVSFDFFLCSHMGIQGTSQPAHYTVFRNDDKLTADQMQRLTYYLCHTYSLCTRSVSIPSAVMYADKAADRALQHAIMAATEAARPVNGIVPVQDNLSGSMYYI